MMHKRMREKAQMRLLNEKSMLLGRISMWQVYIIQIFITVIWFFTKSAVDPTGVFSHLGD